MRLMVRHTGRQAMAARSSSPALAKTERIRSFTHGVPLAPAPVTPDSRSTGGVYGRTARQLCPEANVVRPG
jgi:hypothetical protein